MPSWRGGSLTYALSDGRADASSIVPIWRARRPPCWLFQAISKLMLYWPARCVEEVCGSLAPNHEWKRLQVTTGTRLNTRLAALGVPGLI